MKNNYCKRMPDNNYFGWCKYQNTMTLKNDNYWGVDFYCHNCSNFNDEKHNCNIDNINDNILVENKSKVI